MKKARRWKGLFFVMMLGSLIVPNVHAQNRGSYVAGINYPAGPATVPSNTYFLSGGISPVQILPGQYTSQPNSFLFSDHTKTGVVVAANCEAGYMPTCPGSAAIVVYMSNGDGTFGTPIISGSNLPPSIRSIAIGDFDGDGILDIAAVEDCLSSQDCSGGTLSILRGDGNGNFALMSQYVINGFVTQANTLAVGDFNGDGKLDLVVGIGCYNGCTNGSISVFPGNGDGTLGSPVSYPTVGNGAVLPVVGDFFGHHNGVLDIVAGSYYALSSTQRSSLTVLQGQGNGSFTELPIAPLAFGQLTGLVAADLNGDGNLDLAATTYGATLEILTGNGNGTFNTPVSYQSSLNNLGTDTTSIVVTDLRSTGEQDLVIGAFLNGNNSVQLFFNDGQANFTGGRTYGLGGWLYAPIVAQDFNGDGKVDIVMASACSENANSGHNSCPEGTLSILLGNGDGTMQGARILNQNPTAGQSNSTITADINGDGISDLIQTSFYFSNQDHNQGGVIVSLGIGNGNYGPPTVYPTGLADPFWVAAGDFRGIGKIDLAVASGVGGVAVLLGNGDGSFQPPVTYGSGGSTSLMLGIGDFNGDGKLDVAVMDQLNSIGILIGNGDGTFMPVVVTDTSAGVTASDSIAIGDFDGDGKSDVALLAQSSTPDSAGLYDGVVKVFISNGDGHLSQMGISYDSGGRGNSGSLAVGDVYGHGNLDIVTTNPCQLFDSSCAWGSLGVLQGNGHGMFQSGPLQTVPDGTFYSLSLADINGDGILDAIATNLTGVAVFSGNGDGSFQTPTVYAGVGTGTENISLGLADLNIVQPGISNGLTAILVNKAGTYIVTKPSANPASGSQTVQLTTTVSPSYLTSLTPTGSISYIDGGTNLGSAPLVGGTASFNLTSLPQGVHTITAFYSGDSNFNSHYGTPTLQVMTASLQSTQTITFALGTSTVTFGISPITLSATASSGLAVAFSVISGPGTVSGNTLTVTGAGNIVIEADQAGNSGYSAAAPVQQTLTVSQASPTVSFIGAPGTAGYLSTFVVTATTNATSVATVTAAGACSIVGNTVNMISGTGVCNLSANWAADSNYLASSATQNTIATKIAPTIAFTGAPATAGYNSSFTVSATTNASTTPTIAASGSCSVVGATVTISAPSGTCSLSATWAADNNYLAASAAQSTVATKATPTINWTAPAAIIYGTALSGTQLDAKATYNGATIAGTIVYTPAKGVVLTVGTQTLSVTFTPTKTADYSSASASVTLQVSQATPKITWTKPAAITYGTELSSTQLDATASVPGTLVYSPSTGTLLNAGAQTLSVTFTPTDSIDYAAASKSVTLTVDKAATATSITEVPSSSLLGQLVTFSAVVTSPSRLIPTGTVTFKQGATVLGSASLDTTGLATLATSALIVGDRNITAGYGASTDFGASSSTGVTETVSKLPTSTTVNSSSDPATFGTSVMFTATVALAAGTSTSFAGFPTGSVSFYDGAKKLGVGALSGTGVATFSITTLTRGSHTITAVYVGDGNFITSTSAALVQAVN